MDRFLAERCYVILLQWIQFKTAISAFDGVRTLPTSTTASQAFLIGHSFRRTPRHACPFGKNTARPTELPRCSPSRLKRASITAQLIIQ